MRKSGKRSGSYRPRVALVLLMAVATLLLASCNAGEGGDRDPGSEDDIGQPTPEQQGGSTASEAQVSLRELTRTPDQYYGKQITVNGTVGRVIEPNTFALTSDEAAESDESFEVEAALVAGREGSIPNLSEGQRVRVTGEVQRFNRQEIEQELDVNLDDSLYAEYEEKPVVLPGVVEVLAGGETTGG